MENCFPYQVAEQIMESFNVEGKKWNNQPQLVLSCSSSGFYDGLNYLGHGLH